MTAADAQPGARMRMFGLLAAAAGWAMLAALAVGRVLLGAPRDGGGLTAAIAVACMLIVTGAALVVVAALQAGFGALDAFFTAALARSAQRREEPQFRPKPEPPRRGFIGDRPFVANSDGTVTVETMLGPRLFPSLADAQEFIGA